MANQSGFFEITKFNASRYASGYDLKEINGEREFKMVFENNISDTYEGHCGFRFVTFEAYNAYRQNLIKGMEC